MDTRAMRIALQSVSEEFQNLTDKDLIEPKWSIKKRIYSELITLSPKFYDYNNQINEITEKYNEVLAKNRQEKMSRDIIVENEREYKTKFINILIEVLKLIEWPPVLEAFSDLFEPLHTDHTIFYSAITYILNHIFPGILPIESKPNKTNGNKNKNKSTGKTPIKLKSASINMTSDLQESSSITHDINNMSINITPTTTTDNIINSSYGDDTFIHNNNNNNTNNENNESSYHDVNISRNNISSSMDPTHIHTIEILLYQNKQLSIRLNQLRSILHTRVQFDIKISNFLSYLDDTFSDSSYPTSDHTMDSSTPRSDVPPPPSPTSSTPNNNHMTSTTTTSTTSHHHSSSNSNNNRINMKNNQNNIYDKLISKCRGFKTAWKDIITETSSALRNTYSIPREYLYEINLDRNNTSNATNNGINMSGKTSQKPTSRSAVSGVRTSVNTNNNHTSQIDTNITSTTTTTTSTTVHLKPKYASRILTTPTTHIRGKEGSKLDIHSNITMSNTTDNPLTDNPQLPITTRSLIQKTLGIPDFSSSSQTNPSLKKRNDNSTFSTYNQDEYDTNPSQNTDMSIQVSYEKLSELYRDMLQLTQSISSLFTLISTTKNNTRNDNNSLMNYSMNLSSIKTDPYPLHTVSSQLNHVYTQLFKQIQSIGFHLISYLPLSSIPPNMNTYMTQQNITPLYQFSYIPNITSSSSSSSSAGVQAGSSSTTALDMLITEIENYLSKRKTSNDIFVQFQNLYDNARKEQYQYIHTWYTLHTHYYNTIQYSNQLGPCVDEFIQRLKMNLNKWMTTYFTEDLSYLESIYNNYKLAENSRLNIPPNSLNTITTITTTTTNKPSINVRKPCVTSNRDSNSVEEEDDRELDSTSNMVLSDSILHNTTTTYDNMDTSMTVEYSTLQKKVLKVTKPLESLTKGLLGPEIASLMNTLHTYEPSMKRHIEIIKEGYSEFKIILSKELLLLEQIKNKIKVQYQSTSV